MAHENDWVADIVSDKKIESWENKTWSGYSPSYGKNVWTDGTNVYYSNASEHYVLNKTTSTWDKKIWGGLNYIYGTDVWSDGDNIYYSYGSTQYVLDKSTSTWSTKTWNGYSNMSGSNIWSDGSNIYYSSSSNQYVLDKSTSTWTAKTWRGLTSFDGKYIWSDGDNIYYSYGTRQYVLDTSTSRWSRKSWNNYRPYSGYNVWSDGTNIYYSESSTQKVLDKSTSTWNEKIWDSMPMSGVLGYYIWSDGDNIYFSSTSSGVSQQYVLYSGIKHVTSTPYRLNFPKMIESVDLNGDWVADVIDDGSIPWKPKTWNGTTPTTGMNVWTDGEDIYYDRYILNRSTSTWTELRWTGIGILRGGYVWTDGEHLYYSDGTTQKVLADKSTLTWVDKTWSGLTSFDGHYVWTDGNDIFYSDGQTQYVLNKSTSTWVTKTWTGLTSFDGHNIWTDGTNIYYSHLGDNYVLDKNTHSWQSKTWRGLDRPGFFLGSDVWTDGNDIYYSCLWAGTQPYSANYVLDKSASKWIPKSWPGMVFSGDYVWTDGHDTYLSNGSDQYRFIPKPITSTPYRLNFPELIESTDLRDKWLINDDIPYRMNFPPMIPSIDINSWVIDDDIPYRLNFPELKESIDIYNSWLISDDIPFRLNFPPLIPTNAPSDSWLQDKGWDPRRPWPEHRSIIQKVQTIPNIPDVDWTKSMQQTFEFYTVDPNNWYDDQKLENIISCDLTHDLTSDKRGNASISVTEPLPESYIRTYLVVTQAGYMHKICLGTYLYMTSSDSFDGMKHNITMTGYTPMVELEEKLPPLGFHIIGITNRKHSGDAPMVTDAIKDIVTTYTRCEIENRTVIQKPLLNDFVAGTNDNFLTVINNILNASSLQQYILTVDEWGTIIVKDKPVLEDAIPTYIYTDDNSSILLPSLDTNDDIYGIPNVVEVLYTGDKRLPAIRVIVKNEDPTSIVSIPARGREIAKRFTINNIAAPVNDYSEAAVRAQVTAQAERLLEAASTINKTISYSHGYCDVKVGDTVLINYERAGVTGIRAKVVSQRISCKPGCQVDEQAVYTKKLWNRGV